jgi:enoyl-CoA hydratase/carnithine racemase
MAYETIIYEKELGIATLTFNRPHVLNATNYQMNAELRTAVEEARDDDEVRVLIITGAGRGFHAGDDVKEIFLAEDREKLRAERKLAQMKSSGASRLTLPIDIYKPTVAAVNGPAVGIGLDIAISCDIRLASEKAAFGYFYVRRGLIGGAGGLMLLTHLIGVSRALEMMLSGELIDANEAERIGLVSRVVPQDSLMDEARTLANKLMKAAPLAQQAIKRSVHRAMFEPSSLADFMTPLQQALGETEDHLEGARAFAEKRDPDYKGR